MAAAPSLAHPRMQVDRLLSRRWPRQGSVARLGCLGETDPTECQRALARSLSTKLHAIVDTRSRPLHIALTPGERHEMVAALELLDHARGHALIGDTGYDSNDFRAEILARGIKLVIHSKAR